MNTNLINNIKSYFSDEVVNKLSTSLGEDSGKVNSLIDASIPTLLAALEQKSDDEIGDIVNSSKGLYQNTENGQSLQDAYSLNNSEYPTMESSHLVTGLFGDKFQNVIQGISNHLNVNYSSVSHVLATAFPAVLAGLTRNGQSWDVQTIKNELSANRTSILDALPAGLGLVSFGENIKPIENVSQPTPVEVIPPNYTPPASSQNIVNDEYRKDVPPVIKHNEPVYKEEEKKKGGGLIWILIIALILIALWFFLGKGCQSPKDANDTTTITTPDTSVVIETPQSDIAVTRSFKDIDLENGTIISAYPNGIEENLITFLSSDYKSLSDGELEEKWFDFDNLNFEIGTATLTSDSHQQLSNLSAILAAYPESKIKIGGYTDKTGDESFNEKLSQERADVVKSYLVDKGQGAQVVGAEGYGSEFAKAPATAPDIDRAKDRRIAVSVRR